MKNTIVDKHQGWQNVLQIILPYFVIVAVFQAIGYYFAGLDISNIQFVDRTPAQVFIVSLASFIGTFVTVWLFMIYVLKEPFLSVGFEKKYIKQDVIRGIYYGLIIMSVGFISLILSEEIEFKNLNFNLLSFALSLGHFIFVALSEELLLRGFILNNLMKSFNNYLALIISSVIFSLLHAWNPNITLFGLLQLFVASILLGLPYLYTKNLWFSIALHFSWNFFQGTVFGYNISGMTNYSIIETNFKYASIWNGGDFGFEGSILALILQIIAIVILYLSFENKLKNKLSTQQNTKL
ncbi:lysostaphin resistance A-like protein [Flavobacterium sp. GT2N3]|uniref:CPBP family intramembrane glutamic endopeptidase n=1 Tax=unclassified Flavobacterium TaxID=196869 RepID=UPI003AB00A46